MIGSNTMKQLDRHLEEDLKAELRAQGHFLTGALERSVKSTQREEGNDIELQIVAADYIDQLETGVPASQIVASTAYINAMTRYVELRFGLSGKEARAVAVKIVNKHKVEGNPTAASYAYSETGKRTEVIEETYERNESYYDKFVGDALSLEMDILIDETFTITEL